MARVIYIGAPEADSALFAQRFRTDFPGIDLFATNDRAVAKENAGPSEVLIGHHFQFDEDLIARAPRLRWIQSLTSGTDSILKLSSLRRDIAVTSTRGMHGPQMSELVFLNMLALLRDYPRILSNQRAKCWERWPQPLLVGKTAVLVGVGAISAALAPRCQAFGMKVYGVTASTRDLPGFDGMFSRDELLHAASIADFLILIVPYSAENANLIGAAVIRAMKPTAFLINVARGGVLDEKALVTAIRDRTIAGAALDVFCETPLPSDDPLWTQDRILITPLLGGMSDIYLEQCYPIVRTNLKHYLSGRIDQMLNIVEH